MAGLLDKNVLKTLVPPSSVNAKNFQKLASKALIENVPVGKIIFKEGSADGQFIYLINGRIELQSNSGQIKTIMSNTKIAKYPIANEQPRRCTATAKINSKIIRLNINLLNTLQKSNKPSGIEVDEILTDEKEDDDNDWMTQILQSKTFLQMLPPVNIQAIFMRMQEIPVKANDVIIKQNDEGDYYYIIKRGKCRVTRNTKAGSELTVATLHEGNGFGEEALLSEDKRNANVTMITDGSLIRLSKNDFNQLLKDPILNWITQKEAKAMVKNEGAMWIDVRFEKEYKKSNIKGSINIPLYMLRLKMSLLPKNRKYILYCNDGRRSSTCAFLLNEKGYQVYCLKDGLNGCTQG